MAICKKNEIQNLLAQNQLSVLSARRKNILFCISKRIVDIYTTNKFFLLSQQNFLLNQPKVTTGLAHGKK